MNIEKIKEESNENQQIKEKEKSNNLNTFGLKIDSLKKIKINNIIQKNFILKLLNQNNNDSKDNQIYKIRENSSKKMKLNNLNLNNEDKEIKYKLKIQEKNNIINNLMKEISYYKNDINKNKNKYYFVNNFSNRNIFMYSPKKNNIKEIDLNLGIGKDNQKFKQFHTLDNEHIKNNSKIKINSPKRNNIINIKINDDNFAKNEINVLNKYKYNFPEMKKNKLLQKKYNNLTYENYQFKNINISKIKTIKLNERNNSNENRHNIKTNKMAYLINSSCSNSVSTNKDYENNNYINNQKIKMKELENRMSNLMNNLFSIIEQNNKNI